MALELRDCTFYGPALPEPFVKFQLERELNKRNLLGRTTGPEARALEERWEVFRRKLRQLGEQGGDRRVANHVLEPLIDRLGYASLERQAAVITREGAEDGGWLFSTSDGKKLRGWAVSLGTDLDAPNRRGRAYRFSPSRVAQRVLQASGERMGLLTDGEELRILLCDPARPDSHIGIRLDRAGGWRAARGLPDSYRLLLALASPAGVAALPDLTDAARLAQSSVTKKLRLQARRAIEGFLQELLDHPANQSLLAEQGDRQQLAWRLWSEGLITVYRLLFVFKLEASADPARAFSFAATSLWRNTYSPNTALADLVRRVLDEGKESGGFLESGLRTLWRLFAEGMSSSELEIKPLGGMLFGRGATPLLDQLRWGEQAVARLLDALLWTPGEGGAARERVHYGALDVEDLGRVYESLLELEPGISGEAMCRLRRAKLEVVVPVAQGEPYRANPASADAPETPDDEGQDEESDEPAEENGRRGRAAAGSKTKLEFIEEIPADRFFLRVGLGRKASGSYYTPHPFVRFLVQETLGVLLAECSPRENPQPALILRLKVLDSAMGSGHFLVEACRFLGEGLYEACRLCDELAVQAEEQAEKVEGAERESLLTRAADLRRRVEDLPDPNNELLAYLPSRAAEGEESGLSQKKAEAMCRRLVAVHCLYGVDKNPLAVELAKLSLWLESYAEGLPLTFLDHRLICGDSLTGPFFEHLLTYPKSGKPLDDLFAQELSKQLKARLGIAQVHVDALEASVGKDLADIHLKESTKIKLDNALAPVKTLAAAWSGLSMLGEETADQQYRSLVREVLNKQLEQCPIESFHNVADAIKIGSASVSFDLTFPEAFFGSRRGVYGFDASLGNPPWDVPSVGPIEFASAFNLAIARGQGVASDTQLDDTLLDPDVLKALQQAEMQRIRSKRAIERVALSGNSLSELSAAFFSRMMMLTRRSMGVVMPSALRRNKNQSWLRKALIDKNETTKLFLSKIIGFINKNRLFSDLPAVLQYDLIVADNEEKDAFEIAFGLSTFENLYLDFKSILYPSEAARRLNPGLYTIADLPASRYAETLRTVLLNSGERASSLFNESLISMGQEVNNRTQIKYCKKLDSRGEDPREPSALNELNRIGLVPLIESKSISHYTCNWMGAAHSGWNPVPQYAYPLAQSKADAKKKADQIINGYRYYRLVMRQTCGSPYTNSRSAVAAILPPGMSAFHSAVVEQKPYSVANCLRLEALAVINSFSFDFIARPQIGANFSTFILNGMPWPSINDQARRFLAHLALRLSCNHAGYFPLWREQLGRQGIDGDITRSWSALNADDDRWQLRAFADAVVADAYGLDRGEYEYVLSVFTNSSFPKAPCLCLEAFDELREIGIEDFCQKHDPYWDIPLYESLPQPVLDLEIPGQASMAQSSLGPLFESPSAAASSAEIGASTAHTVTAKQAPAPAPSVRPVGNGAFHTIAELLRSRGVITSIDAQQVTGLDAAGVRPHLQRLVSEGIAVTEGQRRGMKYRRVDD